MLSGPGRAAERTSTTLVAVMIDATVDHRCLVRCATAAHAGLSRVIRPSHTIVDGDTIFAVGLQSGPTDPGRILVISIAVELAVERAIIDAVTA
jgi:L-aminopeptidase/D-esterase-like protein